MVIVDPMAAVDGVRPAITGRLVLLHTSSYTVGVLVGAIVGIKVGCVLGWLLGVLVGANEGYVKYPNRPVPADVLP